MLTPCFVRERNRYFFSERHDEEKRCHLSMNRDACEGNVNEYQSRTLMNICVTGE